MKDKSENEQQRSSLYLESAHEGQVREQTVRIIIIPRTAHEGQVREQTVTIIIIPRICTRRTSMRTNSDDHHYT